MRAVFRHELSSYFTGVTGYVFSAFLLLFTGIYTMVYNLQSASVHFEYVLGSMSFVFLIIVPILTMRVLAEERRQKTDQLLYSLPLTRWCCPPTAMCICPRPTALLWDFSSLAWRCWPSACIFPP